MEKNNELKASLTQKQPQYYPGTINKHALELVNLGHYSLSQQNPNSQSSNISDPILPFAISTAARLFPNNLSMSPGNDDSTTDDSREIGRGREVGVGVVVNNERRLKRMISNRESARRSRMRRKMQIEELQYLVGQLQTTNRQLSEKLIQLLDCNQQILQENSQLKEKVSSLQIILSDLLVPLRNNAGEDHNSSADRMLKAQGSSTPSVTISSMQLLH
ncbi:G-box-binding factor 1 [Morus notabilis]|uniref:G-box-binding factor 1 n=2 Tax=Morus notabilis TaxID=981085 RepID=W9QY74_9ROSA|nr:G-box-binding factor 1 [Morus notabilis]